MLMPAKILQNLLLKGVVEDKSVHVIFFKHLYLINYFVYEANNWSDKCSSVYIL